MAEAKQCQLLSLPRELRNMIYGHITTDECRISLPGILNRRPECTLSSTIYPAMLLLNRQIHAEYLDHTLPRSELVVSYEYAVNLSVSWALKPNVPIEVLKGIRFCRLQVCWRDALYYDCHKVSEFCDRMEVEQIQDQESLSWTPSKEMTRRLKAILSKLHTLLSGSTKIAIVISIAGLDDPSDINMVGLTPIPYNDLERPKHLSRMFNPTTLAKLSSDTTILWPRAGNLTVKFSMKTPLYCTAADREREETSNNPDYILVEDDEEEHPGCFDDGRPMVTWELELTTGEDCYRGFFPRSRR